MPQPSGSVRITVQTTIFFALTIVRVKVIYPGANDSSCGSGSIKVGLEFFPESVFLNERLGDAYEANGMKVEAISQYEKCLRLNPLNRGPAVKLSRLH
jgi:hypothetical protein